MMPAIATIHSLFHQILFDLSTGDYIAEKSELVRSYFPEYKNISTPLFDSTIHASFRLTGETEDVKRHLLECIGDCIYQKSFNSKSNVLFFGDRECSSLLNESILKPVSKMSALIRTAPYHYVEISKVCNFDYNVFPIGKFDFNLWSFCREIKTEIPGIFYQSIEGLSRLIKRGSFLIPESCAKAHTSLFRNIDPVGEFSEKMIVRSPGAKTESSLLYEAFLRFTGGKTGIGKYQFIRQLMDMGIAYDTRGTDRTRSYCYGIALKLP